MRFLDLPQEIKLEIIEKLPIPSYRNLRAACKQLFALDRIPIVSFSSYKSTCESHMKLESRLKLIMKLRMVDVNNSVIEYLVYRLHFHEIDRILTTQPKRASLITENIKEMMFDCEEFYELTSSFVIKLLIAGMATLPIYFGGRCISYHNNIELVRNLFLEDPRVKAGVILHGYLALCRNLDTFRFILEKCDYEPRNRDEHGRSLAHWIALEGTVAQMQIFLLDDRIDSNCLNRSTDFGGITTGPELFNPSKKVLILALCNPDPAMFKLIFLDPRTDVWATDFNGDTLLDMAIRSVDSLNPGEMIGTIKVILDDGRINPNTRSLQAIATGLMPIHLAILRQIHPLFTILADDQRVDMSVMFDGLSLLDFANLNCEIDFVHSIKQRLLQ